MVLAPCGGPVAEECARLLRPGKLYRFAIALDPEGDEDLSREPELQQLALASEDRAYADGFTQVDHLHRIAEHRTVERTKSRAVAKS